MKQQLWILNSSLLLMFLATLIINVLMEQKPIIFKIKKPLIEVGIKKKVPIIISLEKINKQDIFDTFTPTSKTISKKSFATPIPEPKPIFISPPPQPKKQAFIPPLTLTLKGIISISNENKSVAMIADETNKENLYHLGGKIKDGQILRITQNKVVILRSNGQQEILFLRKKEERLGQPPQQTPAEKWKYSIKTIDAQNYEIDPNEFALEISSLGELIETLDLGTAYQKGSPVGIRIGKMGQNNLGATIGLNNNDIIISINDIDTAQTKNRIKIYDLISQMEIGNNIKVLLKRNNQKLQLNYKIAKVGKPAKTLFTSEGQTSGQPGVFKMSPTQEREKKMRDFRQFHRPPRQQGMASDIRQRLLENMRQRNMNRRVR